MLVQKHELEIEVDGQYHFMDKSQCHIKIIQHVCGVMCVVLSKIEKYGIPKDRPKQQN
jgi:hypothetical protein